MASASKHFFSSMMNLHTVVRSHLPIERTGLKFRDRPVDAARQPACHLPTAMKSTVNIKRSV
jgi:hypothetical protein